MRQRALGRTGLEVSELGLGTWGLSGDGYGHVDEAEGRAVLERALVMGVDLIETAASYARGHMETRIGEVLAGDRQALVVTKWGTDQSHDPARKCFDADFLRRVADESLGRLGPGTRVVALLHNPSRRALDAGATSVLASMQKEGRLSSWGVSAGSVDVARRALELGAPVVSLTYNLLEVGTLRALEAELGKAGAGVLVHSVLAYGLLTGRWSMGKEFSAGDHRAERWPDGSLRARLRHLDALRPLVSGDIPSLRAAAVRYALTPSCVSSVLLGPRSVAQLDQLVRDAQADPPYFSEQKLSGLEGRLSHLGVSR